MILSDTHLSSLAERFPRMSHQFGGAAGEKTFGAVLQTVEFVGVAGAMSYLNVRHAAPGRLAYEVAGVPADLAFGLLFSGLAMTGYFGEHAKHGYTVGNGFLAAYACRMGSVWGHAARAAKDAQTSLGNAPVRGAFGNPYATGQEGVAGQRARGYPWAA